MEKVKKVEEYPILYTFRRCPHAIKARMALHYSSITYELREISLKNKPNIMYEIIDNPTVPLLVFNNGYYLNESNTIVEYALNYNDPENFRYYDKESGIDQYGFINGFIPKLQIAVTKYKYFEQYGITQPTAIKELFKYLDDIEKILSKYNFIMGYEMSYIDIILFPYIRQAKVNNRDFFSLWPFPKIQAWVLHIEGLSFFQSSMIKYSAWEKGSVPIIVNR